MPSSVEKELCPDCGAIIPPDAPGGNCLRCLFMDPPNADDLSDLAGKENPEADNALGSIGPYRLIERLGEGGFGEVFLAEQRRPVQRQVAIKVIKPGMDTRQVIARFEAERQALALMDHPLITRVLDAGETEEGRLYFVMEVVRGDALTTYCARNKTSVEDRLKLFLQVCEAVHDAHRKGIIHRDLKPSNIVVTTTGEQATPKIIDFGIAKATQHTLTASTLYTMPDQMIGTPEYMSPEQARGRLDIDTRADVYSLGMVLYELLGGDIPFRREDFPGGPHELTTAICEKLPLPPSSRPDAIVEAGDLDLIALKAISKERERRYDSVAALGSDISRYLAHEPIEARPLTVGYRLGRFARKNRTAVAGACAVALALLIGTIVSIVLAVQAEQARQGSEDARKTTEEAQAETKSAFSHSDFVRAGELLERGEADAAAALLCRAVRTDPGNLAASFKLLTTLENENFAVPRHALLHDHYVFRCTFSPDGRYLVTGAANNVATIWDVETGKQHVPPLKHRSRVKGLAVSPDSTMVATGDLAGELRIWELATGKLLAGPFPNQGEIVHCQFTNDGSRVLLSTWAGWVTAWDWRERRWAWRRLFNGGAVPALAMSANGLVTAAGCWDGSVRVWDTETGRLLFTPNLMLDSTVLDVDLSHDGRRLATSCKDGRVRVWDTMTGDPVTDELHHNGPVLEVDFSPDGTVVASCSEDKTARLWNAETGEPLITPLEHARGVTDIEISPQGDRFVTTGHDGWLRLWDLETGYPLAQPMRHGNWIEKAAFSPDGSLVATACHDETATLWDVRPRAAVQPSFRVPGRLLELAITPEGDRVLARADSPHRITAHDTATGAPLDYEPLRGLSARLAVMNPAEPLVAASLASGEILICRGWQAERISVTRRTRRPGSALTLDPLGEFLVVGYPNGEVETWNLTVNPPALLHSDQTGLGAIMRVAIGKDGNSTAARNKNGRGWVRWQSGDPTMLPKEVKAQSLSYSDDGSRLASGGADGSVRVWDTTSGQLVIPALMHSFIRFRESPLPLFIGGADRLLTTRWEDNMLREWNLAEGGTEQRIVQSKYFVRYAREGPDSRLLAVGCDDGTAHLLDLSTGEWLASFANRHRSIVTALAFSEDGRQLATGSIDGTANLWRLPMIEQPAPSWLLSLIESFLDRAPDKHSLRRRNSALDLARLQSRIPDDSPFAAWAEWFFHDPSDRARSPWLPDSQPAPIVATGGRPIATDDQDQIQRIVDLRKRAREDSPSAPDLLAKACDLAGQADALGLQRAIHWQRAGVFRSQHQRDQGQADLLAALKIPPRDPTTPVECLDLSPYYTTGLDEAWDNPYSQHGAWRLSKLPRGFQRLNGIPYDLRGIVQIVSDDAGWKNAYRDLFPTSVDIAIARPCKRIHVVHSCLVKMPPSQYGTVIGQIDLVRAGGTVQRTPLVYGENVLDWRLSNQELTHIDLTPELNLAWRGERPGDIEPSNPSFPHLCLFHTVLKNTVPGSVIERLQLAPGEAKTSPFLVAVTVE